MTSASVSIRSSRILRNREKSCPPQPASLPRHPGAALVAAATAIRDIRGVLRSAPARLLACRGILKPIPQDPRGTYRHTRGRHRRRAWQGPLDAVGEIQRGMEVVEFATAARNC